MSNIHDFLNDLSVDKGSSSSVKYIGMALAKPSFKFAPELDTKGQRRLNISFTNDKFPGLRGNYSIWFKNEDLVSAKTGTARYIDKRGATSIYVSAPDVATSLDQESARIAKKGECDFMEFVRPWVSYNKNSKDFPPFDIAKIEAGDYSEVEPMFEKFKDVHVGCIFGVNNDKYQNVYPKFYASWMFNQNNEAEIKKYKELEIKIETMIKKDDKGSIFSAIPLIPYSEFSAVTKVENIGDSDGLPF